MKINNQNVGYNQNPFCFYFFAIVFSTFIFIVFISIPDILPLVQPGTHIVVVA